ncbi:MAG: DUF5615 family PIN-like protein [Actinomycetota bacterium]
MTVRFLIDEMFPTDAAVRLRDIASIDAVHVVEIGLRGADDDIVVSVARADGRVLVTENVVDFVGEGDVAIVFVLKSNLPSGGAMGAALADLLSGWARANPDPYLGPHWPG